MVSVSGHRLRKALVKQPHATSAAAYAGKLVRQVRKLLGRPDPSSGYGLFQRTHAKARAAVSRPATAHRRLATVRRIEGPAVGPFCREALGTAVALSELGAGASSWAVGRSTVRALMVIATLLGKGENRGRGEVTRHS
jgi:hypothetical protein